MEALLQSNWSTDDNPAAQGGSHAASLPYRKLAAAMILEALNAIANPKHLPALYPQTSQARLDQRRETDRRWFESKREVSPLPDYPILSYSECCSILGLDPTRLRNQLRRRGWLDGTKSFNPRAAHRLVDIDRESEAHG